MIDKKTILATLNTRALNRGFNNLDHAVTFLDTADLEVVYVVVKKYSFKDIYDGCKLLSAKTTKDGYWYKNCWTKTIVLAGDPIKLAKRYRFYYVTENVGFVGPVLQSTIVAKRLTALLPALATKPKNIEHYKHDSPSNIKLLFKTMDLSLGKFIVQLIHMIVEMDKDVELTEEPAIGVLYSLEHLTDAKYTYLRIDGGKTEVEPFTHIATGVVI